MQKMNADLDNVKDATAASLTAADPVLLSIYFEARWRGFFNGVLMNGAIGEVEHYFWRYEYQDRGAPHIHMKLWIKHAPILGETSDEEILNYINKYISCSLKTGNLELDDLVQRFEFIFTLSLLYAAILPMW
jgi:hypothetical protein